MAKIVRKNEMNDNAVVFLILVLYKYYHDELGRQKVVLVDNPNNRAWNRMAFSFFSMRMNTFTQDEFQTIRSIFEIFGSENFLFPFEHTKTKPFAFSPVMLPPKVCGP